MFRVFLLLTTTGLVKTSGLSGLCEQCPGVVRNGSRVMSDCVTRQGEVMMRCCVLSDCRNCSEVVIGLDWSYCNVTELRDYTFSDVGTSLSSLDVSGNTMTISRRAFGGLTNLTVLVLPSNVNCSSEAWSGSNSTENTTVCYDPVWPCGWQDIDQPDSSYDTSDDMDWSNNTGSNFTVLCPPHSYCLPDGPGLHQCLCSDGYHGYKCLLEGQFPYVAFFGSSVGGTVVVMVIYWCMRISEKVLQRRKSITLEIND